MRLTVLLDSGIEHLALAAAVPLSPAASGSLLYYGDTLYRPHRLLSPRLRAFRLCDMLEAIAPRAPGVVVVLGPILPDLFRQTLTGAAESNGSHLVFSGELPAITSDDGVGTAAALDAFAAVTGVRGATAKHLVLTAPSDELARRSETRPDAFPFVAGLETPRRWAAAPYDLLLEYDGELA